MKFNPRWYLPEQYISNEKEKIVEMIGSTKNIIKVDPNDGSQVWASLYRTDQLDDIIDITTTEKLLRDIPDDRDVISESGFSSHKEINYIIGKGVFRFLIGEHLMKQKNIEKATYSLLQNSAIKNNLTK